MIIFKISAELTAHIKNHKAGSSIGFVPTMGALHSGHISLIERSKKENRITVCSIFVNPTQFNNPDDFKKYPITIENDIDMLEKWGCDILFLPAVDEVYPPGSVKLHYELGYLETVLEGKYRPGHFQGVCQVVDRLLEIVIPNKLYLGQKDFQQCMVIRKLVEIKNIDTELIICPTLRETDGLAMSSRNARLDPAERILAVKIYETLLLVKNEIQAGSLDELRSKAVKYLSSFGFKTDYIEIADASNLALTDTWDGRKKLVVLIAAYLNDVRLIDNLVLS
ncbi:MAG: pantoate--beta-alanine ligase [Ferruginibacter sp.]